MRRKPEGDKIVGELRPRLVRFAAKLLWNRQDAEEAVQEAFRLALSNGLSFSQERFVPWLYRTVNNLARNLRRRRKPEPLAAWADLAHAVTPEARAQLIERLERLRQAVARLPEQQRTALVLRTMEQMDYQRIAEILELSVSAVRTHVHLARERLVLLLEGESAACSEVRS